MDFNNMTTSLNTNSFLQQKINLNIYNEQQASATFHRELFLIPRFTVIGFPVANAESTSYYYLQLQIIGAYSHIVDGQYATEGELHGVIFQYDVNYSKIAGGRGQISLDSLIKWYFQAPTWIFLFNKVKNANNKKDESCNIWDTTYKIILPVAVLNKDSVNTLNYSFVSEKKDSFVNNKNNFGTLSFYFDSNPLFTLQIKLNNFFDNNFLIELKNPIILETDFNYTTFDALFTNSNLKHLVMGGKGKVDEIFTFSGSLNAFNVKRKIVINTDEKEETLPFSSEMIQKILMFNDNFDLQQHTFLTISGKEANNYQDHKIPAVLQRSTMFSSNNNYQLLFTSIGYNDDYSNIILQPDMENNHWQIPLFNAFAIDISLPLVFTTFFKYNINIKFSTTSDEPIIGGEYSLVHIEKIIKNDEVWTTATNITLSYDEILAFYSSDNFTFLDYKHLLKQVVNTNV